MGSLTLLTMGLFKIKCRGKEWLINRNVGINQTFNSPTHNILKYNYLKVLDLFAVTEFGPFG